MVTSVSVPHNEAVSVESPLQILKSVREVAESLKKSSFAVYLVENDMKDLIAAASIEALAFFKSSDVDTFRNVNNIVSIDNADDSTADSAHSSARIGMNHRYRAIVGGHLHGYNEPSNAKLLFRAFAADGSKAHQPWPNKQFKIVSTKLSSRLHTLLVDCMTALQAPHDSCNDTPTPSRKRIKRDLSQEGCPLDYFLYHGTNPAVVNCSAHVDRGVLICICLSSVPGLELFHNGAWVCPEEIVQNGAAKSSLVCILAGQQLNTVLSRSGRNNNGIPPCIHRVRNALPRERLSITYEWRYRNL